MSRTDLYPFVYFHEDGRSLVSIGFRFWGEGEPALPELGAMFLERHIPYLRISDSELLHGACHVNLILGSDGLTLTAQVLTHDAVVAQATTVIQAGIPQAIARSRASGGRLVLTVLHPRRDELLLDVCCIRVDSVELQGFPTR